MPSFRIGKEFYKIMAENNSKRLWLSKEQLEWCKEHISRVPKFRRIWTYDDTGWESRWRIPHDFDKPDGPADTIYQRYDLVLSFATDADLIAFKLRWLW